MHLDRQGVDGVNIICASIFNGIRRQLEDLERVLGKARRVDSDSFIHTGIHTESLNLANRRRLLG